MEECGGCGARCPKLRICSSRSAIIGEHASTFEIRTVRYSYLDTPMAPYQLVRIKIEHSSCDATIFLGGANSSPCFLFHPTPSPQSQDPTSLRKNHVNGAGYGWGDATHRWWNLPCGHLQPAQTSHNRFSGDGDVCSLIGDLSQ
jgi:hypothetical protein